jgi:magnesium-transporting ATPase (P-type)
VTTGTSPLESIVVDNPGDPTATGLSSAEAASRLARDGANVLPLARPPSPWRQLLGQMTHFFAAMLWVAGLLAIVAGMPELGTAIFVVVVINGVFAYAQEHRAERAALRLRDLLPRRATVIREGNRRLIDAAELVSGDVVVLSAGDRVCADLRLTRVTGLALDTSLLTGESAPATAETGDPAFAGSYVVEGEGVAEVTAIGGHTRLAGIARLTRAGARPQSPLAVELHRVVRLVAIMAVGVGVGFFAIALALGTPPSDGVLFAIGVTVALVPEGLLPTVTLALARGAQRMAHRNALVRRLESVETLGSTTFICTDKTGTLTLNQMAIVEAWTPAGWASVHGDGYSPQATVIVAPEARPAIIDLALDARRCSTGRVVPAEGDWVADGDPMEAAIDALAHRMGGVLPPAALPQIRFPFDPRRRRMSVVTDGRLVVKGAPESLLPRCRPCPGVEDAVRRLTERGLRVLAVAARPWDGGAESAGLAADDVERGLAVVGLLGFEDPPRPHAAAAIAACRQAGIRVAMITGDHPVTARVIAVEVGLLSPDGIVVDGADLPEDDAALGELVDRDGIVISRVTPEDKLRIARALQGRGHVVAMTGDGVNDGPALQAADIGIAMGRSGTDVAREASDLVLLDDDFATIVAAVAEGRATFANVRRFLTYHLTDNVAELTPFVVWALSAGRFPLALAVLQVLCLDIGTDLLPALALGGEPARPDVLEQPPLRGHLLDRGVLRRAFGLLGPVEAAVEMTAFTVGLVAAGWRPGLEFPTGPALLAASGAAFSAVVFGQLGNAFACRSTTQPAWRLGWTTNRLLLGAVLTELGALAGFLFVGPVARVLGQAPPAAAAAAVAFLAAPLVVLADGLDKRRARTTRSSRTALHHGTFSPGANLPAPVPWGQRQAKG